MRVIVGLLVVGVDNSIFVFENESCIAAPIPITLTINH